MDGIERNASADEASRRYYFLHRPAHLDAAGDRAALDALLLDPAWLKAKLEAIGSPQALVADYDQFAQGEVQDLIAPNAAADLGDLRARQASAHTTTSRPIDVEDLRR